MREEDSEFGGTGRAGNLPEKKRGRDGKRDEFGGGRTGRVPKEKWRGEKNGGRGSGQRGNGQPPFRRQATLAAAWLACESASHSLRSYLLPLTSNVCAQPLPSEYSYRSRPYVLHLRGSSHRRVEFCDGGAFECEI